jgi:hypothetical protein
MPIELKDNTDNMADDKEETQPQEEVQEVQESDDVPKEKGSGKAIGRWYRIAHTDNRKQMASGILSPKALATQQAIRSNQV